MAASAELAGRKVSQGKHTQREGRLIIAVQEA